MHLLRWPPLTQHTAFLSLACVQIFLQLKYYSAPKEQVRVLFCPWRALRPHSPLKTRLPSRAQRYIIRLLIMPIMYSSMSAAALQVGLPNAIYYETMRDWCVPPPANAFSPAWRARLTLVSVRRALAATSHGLFTTS